MPVGKEAMVRSQERPASTFNGYLLLLLWVALLAWTIWSFLAFAGNADRGVFIGWLLAGAVGGLVLAVLVLCGFFMIQPNMSAVITLFGAYRGTERSEGLRWIWPWMGRKKIAVRQHNIHSERVKVNDLRGNPIEVACNVVWRVADTAQAAFDVDDDTAFVNIQIEAGLRTVASRHPYDDIEENETTLRSDGEIVNAELRTELNERLTHAGIVVDEAGLTHLAYAPEIAGAMLQRQQAEAVVAARYKIVEGAVGMVQDALHLLKEGSIVELDEERRASMVSNLMVVLCSDHATSPVVNVGTLYH